MTSENVPAGSPSRGWDVAVYVLNINQLSLPSPFYSVPVSVSIFMALSAVFHSINSPDNSSLPHSVLLVLFLPYWSFQLYIFSRKSPQPWYSPLWLTGLKAPTNWLPLENCESMAISTSMFWLAFCVCGIVDMKKIGMCGRSMSHYEPAFVVGGELRTQKLKSHLVRTQRLNVLPLKSGVGQYIALHATLTSRDFFLAYFHPSSPFTCIFSKTSPSFSCVGCGYGSCVSLQNKTGHPAGCRFPCWVPTEYKQV